MAVPSISRIAVEQHIAHQATLAKIRNRPDGSLRSVSADPAKRLRKPADFAWLAAAHRNRPEPWMRYDIKRSEVERVFPGLGVNADPLRAWYKPDGTIVKSDELVTVIKQVRRSRDPKLVHPQPPTMDDGDIIAVFPTALEKQLRPNEKPIGEATKHEDFGGLTGNHMAWGKGRKALAAGRVSTRFRSMWRGAAEGFGDPRMMGRIMCNLGLTSVAISALLYSVLYLTNYSETQHSLHHEKKHEQALQPAAGPAGTYVLSA